MNTLLAPLWEIGEFEEIQKQLDKENGCVALTGCIESQKLHMAYGLSEGRFQNRIFVTYSDQRIKELLEDERFYDRDFQWIAGSSHRSSGLIRSHLPTIQYDRDFLLSGRRYPQSRRAH